MHLVTKILDNSKDSCWLNLNYRFKTAIKSMFELLQTFFSHSTFKNVLQDFFSQWTELKNQLKYK